jgi:hypothetical protein
LSNQFSQWQLVFSAFTFVKIGYHLFYSISKDAKGTTTDLSAASFADRKKHTAVLGQVFNLEAQKFIEILDCTLHKKPTTTDWAAIVTSVALIFDMFQYVVQSTPSWTIPRKTVCLVLSFPLLCMSCLNNPSLLLISPLFQLYFSDVGRAFHVQVIKNHQKQLIMHETTKIGELLGLGIMGCDFGSR